jgi:HKD family nuclease
MPVAVEVVPPTGLLRAVREVVTDADDAPLCVAFANEAGVNLIAQALRSMRTRLLATTVFGDTTATAMERARSLGVEVRVLNPPSGTYHPKLSLSRSGPRGQALVGSANLTSGLLRNVEVAVLLDASSLLGNTSRRGESLPGTYDEARAQGTGGRPADSAHSRPGGSGIIC